MSEEEKINGENNYSASNIQVLEGLEANIHFSEYISCELFFVVFVLFCFVFVLFFETGFLCIALAILELTL